MSKQTLQHIRVCPEGVAAWAQPGDHANQGRLGKQYNKVIYQLSFRPKRTHTLLTEYTENLMIMDTHMDTHAHILPQYAHWDFLDFCPTITTSVE